MATHLGSFLQLCVIFSSGDIFFVLIVVCVLCKPVRILYFCAWYGCLRNFIGRVLTFEISPITSTHRSIPSLASRGSFLRRCPPVPLILGAVWVVKVGGLLAGRAHTRHNFLCPLPMNSGQLAPLCAYKSLERQVWLSSTSPSVSNFLVPASSTNFITC